MFPKSQLVLMEKYFQKSLTIIYLEVSNMIISMCKVGVLKTLAFGMIEKMMSQGLKAIDTCLEVKPYLLSFLS